VFIAVAILGLLVVGGVLGAALNFGSGILGIPLVLLFIGAILGRESMERQRRIHQMKRFRRDARAQKVDFDDEDMLTTVHET
jgi:Sec-independent protein secretion pathway component TatC